MLDKIFDAEFEKQLIEMYRKFFRHEITIDELQALKAKLSENIACFSDKTESNC